MVMNTDGLEGEVFNIGSGIELSILEVAGGILGALEKPDNLIRRVTDRPGHVPRHAVATEKIASRLGWKAEVDFAEGLALTVDWYRNNREWWEKIKSGEFKDYYRRMYKDLHEK